MANIFQKIFGKKPEIKEIGDLATKPKPTGYETQGYGFTSEAKKTEYLNELRGWVGASVNAIADEIASIDIRLFKTDKNDSVVEVLEHPVLDLLYKVNDMTTKFDHFWLTQSYLELTGEAPWFLEKTGTTITGIYFLRPDRFTPIVGKDNLISGYKYRVGNLEEVTIPVDQVIFLKYPNPANPFRGIGTLEMAARIVDIDNYAEEWNKNFYINSAHPDSVLTVDVEQMSDEQKDKLKASLREQYQGFKKAHQTMVLFGKMTWSKVNMTQKEMDFLEQQRFSRDKILGIFRVPKAVVSQTEGVNYASATAAQYTFARWTIAPKMERLIQQLNEFLLPLFPGTETMFLDYDTPVHEDEEVKSRVRNSSVASGVMTINEARAELNLPDVEGGDTIYLPFGLMPIGEEAPTEIPPTGDGTIKHIQLKSIEKTKKLISNNQVVRLKQLHSRSKKYIETEKMKDELIKEISQKIKQQLLSGNGKKGIKEVFVPSKILSIEQKNAFWEEKNALTNKYLREIRRLIQNIFKAQKKKTQAKFSQFKAFKLDPNTVYNGVKLNGTEETKIMLDITLPTFKKLFEEAGDATFRLLSVDEQMDADQEHIQELLKSRIRKFSIASTDYTNERLKAEIIRGLAEGRTVDELKEVVGKFFDSSEDYRADRIAKTETVRYNVAATEEAFIESDVVAYKEWFVNPNACEICLPMSGKKLPLGENYYNKGDTTPQGVDIDYDDVAGPPLHVNCACELIPVFK